MASIPPIQPPYGTREQWRAVKAQARAQKAAYRMEREAYRNQVRIRGAHRGSILGPLLLIALGVVLLLAKLGRLPAETVAHLYAQWWPLLLVLGGLVLLAEWGVDQMTSVNSLPYVRRSVGGGTVFLLILLAAGGAVTHSTLNGREFLERNFALDPAEMGGLLGEKQESESEVDQNLAPGTRVAIVNARGDVSITGVSSDGRLHVTVNKSVYGLSGDETQRRFDALNPQARLLDGTLTLEVHPVSAGSADLTITLPAATATTVTANHGAVTAADLRAPLALTVTHGDVDVSNLGGNLTARVNSSGSSFSAHGITGDLTLKGQAEDLNVADVTGQTSLEGEFFGDSHLEHLHGPTVFATSRTQFHTGAVADQVDISNGASMTGTRLIGPTTLRTRSRNISFDQVSGDLSVTNSNGTVEISEANPLGNVSVTDRDGAVTFNLPAHSGITLQAETQDGHIQNNLELTPVTQDNDTRLRGRLGDGKAQIDLRTSNADIEIHSGAAAASSGSHNE